MCLVGYERVRTSLDEFVVGFGWLLRSLEEFGCVWSCVRRYMRSCFLWLAGRCLAGFGGVVFGVVFWLAPNEFGRVRRSSELVLVGFERGRTSSADVVDVLGCVARGVCGFCLLTLRKHTGASA